MNRYELLFMDDDDKMPSPATPAETVAKTKPAASAAAAPKAAAPKPAQSATKKVNAAAAGEKENKASTLNKNDANKKGKVGAASRNDGNKTRTNNNGTVERTQGGGGGGGLKPQNERREQRTYNNGNNNSYNNNNNTANRRNVREGGGNSGGAGDFGNEQRPPRQFRDRDNRGPPRNRFENGGGFRGGKREFDRQSGSDKTGIKAVDKRDGAGAHNWGSAKQDIEDLNKSNNETETALTDKDESANEQTTDAVAVAEEEESKEMTLDEWKALRQQRSKPEYNLRKAGEGEDTTQWKKMVVLNKKTDGTEEEEFEFDPSLYPQRVGRLQRIVDIQFNFKDGRRSGGGGFGRGRGRGGGPRPEGGQRSGGDRSDRRAQGGEGGHNTTAGRTPRNALKVDDERQFPTLS